VSQPQLTYQQAIEYALKAREAGEAALARRWAGYAARLAPDEEIPWLILGSLAKPRASYEYYRQALKIDPTHGNASNNLASLYYMIKKYDKALYYLNQAEANGADINPDFKKALLKAMKDK